MTTPNHLALHGIREEFQRYPLEEPSQHARHWNFFPREKHDLLAHALLYLCKGMHIDRAAVFLYDEDRDALVARQLVDGADVLPGEEEIAILPHSPIREVLAGLRTSLTLNRPVPTVYIPLRAFGAIFGILR